MWLNGKIIGRMALGYAAASVAVIACALGLARPAFAGAVTGNATLTTDYIWRGSTQTLGKPAAQAGITLAATKGFYASAWGSNVEFGSALSASSEFDLTVGWAGKVGADWTVNVNALRYVYPGTTVNVDWNELNASATWRDRAWLGVGYSTNAMATGAPGTYVNGGVRVPAGDTLRFEIGAGHYALADALQDYSHAWASTVWAFKAPFELRITAHATDQRAKTRFGNDLAGNRVEAAVQASF